MLTKISDKKPDNILGRRRQGGGHRGRRRGAAAVRPCRFLDALRERGQLPRRTKITEVHQDEERARSITPAFPRTPLQSADGVLGHGEQVWEVPEGAEVLASSDKTGVEMFRVGEHVLGIQGHPEYTKDILLSLVDRLLAAGSITVSAIRLQTPLPLLDL